MGLFSKQPPVDQRKMALDYEISLGESQLKIFRKAVDFYRLGLKKKNEYDEKAVALLVQELPEDADIDSFINDISES